MSSFRQYGGLNRAASNNIVRSQYSTSENPSITNFMGQWNSKIVSESHVDLSGNTLMGVQDIWFTNGTIFNGTQQSSTTGNFFVNGTLTVTGATMLQSTLSVSGAATVGGSLGVTGTSTLGTTTATSLGVTGNATVSGTLGVTGTSTLGTTIAGATTATSLGVSGNATVSGTLGVTGTSTLGTTIAGATNVTSLGVSGNATVGGTLGVTGAASALTFTSGSDYRIKENVQQLDNSFTIDNLNPVTYNNKISGKQDMGFIAHEVQEIFPFLVSGVKDGKETQTLNYIGLIAVLTKEIQDLKIRLNILEGINN